MITAKDFYSALIQNDIDFFTGVPDSLLKDICAYITDNAKKDQHIICANEGNAVALAAGYYLSTGKIPMVYMQNSGMGNMTNPILSLADRDVYSIPILLLIGWRGEPGIKDEPQHIKQGKVTLELLKTLGIPYKILDSSSYNIISLIREMVTQAYSFNAPVAIVVRKGTFEAYKLSKLVKSEYSLSREQALKSVVDELNEQDIVISTTGKTSRELFEYREELNQEHDRDFLTVGSMGHSNHIALGIALMQNDRKVFCFDGDGAALMHLGSLPIIGSISPVNYNHILFNNGSHDSVGGQQTVGFQVDFCKIAIACGYTWTKRVQTITDIKLSLKKMRERKGPNFLEIMVCKGARKDLGRPTTTPVENKIRFMKYLSK